MTEHEPIHVCVYGDPGLKKSSFAATFPKPILVLFFDDLAKSAPYYRAVENHSVKRVKHPLGIPVTNILDSKGKLAIRIESFHDSEKKPDALSLYRKRMSNFSDEFDKWKTVVIDSMTSMSQAAKMEQKLVVNPMSVSEGAENSGEELDKKGLRWFAGATDALEPLVSHRPRGWPMNVVIICHSTEDRVQIKVDRNASDRKRVEFQDTLMRGVSAPGRLGRKDGILATYSEVYYACKIDGKAMLVTESDEWITNTQIRPPNPCPCRYDALWKGRKEE